MDSVLEVEGVGLLVITSVMAALMDPVMDLGDHRGAVHGVVNYGGSGGDGAVHCVVMNRLGEAAVSAVMHRGLGGTNIVSCGVRHGGQGRACTQTDKMSLRSAAAILSRFVLDI